MSELRTARVAPGKTVEVSTGERVMIATDVYGRRIYGPAIKRVPAGQEVTLPAPTIARLRRRGLVKA